jgi:hypothetical protein
MTISSRTQSRLAKVKLIQDIHEISFALLALEHKDRERVRITEFRKIANNLKEVYNLCKYGKSDV